MEKEIRSLSMLGHLSGAICSLGGITSGVPATRVPRKEPARFLLDVAFFKKATPR
jgi:hypothetical protein